MLCLIPTRPLGCSLVARLCRQIDSPTICSLLLAVSSSGTHLSKVLRISCNDMWRENRRPLEHIPSCFLNA